ncbi:MAG: B12-binding domain-containing radical SAM protein [Candidatus Coatesbacteria bacterium]|nr:B12-binding domain-containing radical SAM protein [Candidatus Coatesbacteria bacterium]
MKILFLYPKTIFQTWPLATDLSRFVYRYPAVTFPLFASTVSKENEVRIYDDVVDNSSMKEYKKILEWADIIAISLQSAKLLLNCQITLKLIRKINPDAKTIIGGQHPSLNFDFWKDRIGNEVDILVCGEADFTFPRIVKAIKGMDNLEEIPGVSFRKNGELITSPPPIPVDDLDKTPFPDWTKSRIDKYALRFYPKRVLCGSVESSRGCKNACTFCGTSKMWDHKQRFKSAERVLEEIDILVKMGIKELSYVDDNFGGDVERDTEICKKIIERNYNIKWWCFMRADTVLKNPEFIEIAGKSGFSQVVMGFESLAPSRLKKFKKGYDKELSIEQYLTVYQRLRKAGTFVIGQFIIGGINETEEELKTTLENCHLVCDCPTVNYFEPVAGTEDSRKLIESHNLDMIEIHYSIREISSLIESHISKDFYKFNIMNYLSPRSLGKFFSSDIVIRNYYRSIYRSVFKNLTALNPERLRDYFIIHNKKLNTKEKIEKIRSLYLSDGFIESL